METSAPVLEVKDQQVKEEPKIVLVEQKFKIIVNTRKGEYNPLPKQLQVHKGRVGSQFQVVGGQATQAILRPLTNLQERYFATQLINKSPNDNGYNEQMTTYWAEYSIDIPEKGLELDASYKLEKLKIDGEMIEIENPIYLDQYIKANFLKGSSRVAFHQDEKDNSALFDFIMDDLSIVKKNQVDAFKLEIKADEKYVDLVKSYNSGKPNEKIDYLLDVLKDDNEHFYSADIETKLMRLKKLAKDKSLEFVKAYDNPNLEYEALVFRLVQTRLITKEGQLYFNGEISLGGYKEAIEYMKDQTKSGEVAKLKARLKETLLKKV